MDWSEVQKLIGDLERVRVDYKETPYLEADPKDIAADLVAFANRQGRHILVGIKDDKSKEGKKINADESQLRILNIANNNCSPPVSLSFDFHSASDGDVLIVYVHRKKDMPHAVVERRGAEIYRRTYYVRSGGGKRLVDDSVLRFLFREQFELEIDTAASLCFWYDRSSPTQNIMEGVADYSNYMYAFLKRLNSSDLQQLLSDEKKMMAGLILEIFPYAFLLDLSWRFTFSWASRINRGSDVMSSFTPSRAADLPSSNITYKEIPLPSGPTLSKLSLDVAQVFRESPFQLKLPKGTTIEIENRSEDTFLTLKNPKFTVSIGMSISNWNEGLPYPVALPEGEDNDEKYAFVKFNMMFDADFNLPDVSDDLFEEHSKFVHTIEDTILNEWHWDVVVAKLKDRRIDNIQNNVRNILAYMENPDPEYES
ncbi:divergent AAA domain-containing protein [Candidatus Nitrososphaera gargensis Ga9.2]|uniref:Divergent AAA domain-containing protein n=1 Tax=Nitrososphaera gargensis (strain Ga9.2) TaxID=1237085 RepID=K0IEL4_NITGG|nr:ATP-binding protein [Candidatus Nitrososphaera gargensis]AFU58190.1 divergent AAA domain-containing protein [Candidatus Nitrososphaera gargensis Ga9.2]